MTGLVVAPSAIAARIVEQLVLRAGCRDVRTCHTARDAEAAVRAGLTPAILATEWDLPDRSGLDLARAVREATGCATLPVLLIGTRNTRDDVVEALDAGVDLYVLKPVDPDAFVSRAAALVRGVAGDPAAAAAVDGPVATAAQELPTAADEAAAGTEDPEAATEEPEAAAA